MCSIFVEMDYFSRHKLMVFVLYTLLGLEDYYVGLVGYSRGDQKMAN
jgi:hypothetical protein